MIAQVTAQLCFGKAAIVRPKAPPTGPIPSQTTHKFYISLTCDSDIESESGGESEAAATTYTHAWNP